jgi:hypothetical protein
MAGDLFVAGRKVFEVVAVDDDMVRFSIRGCLGVLPMKIDAWIELVAKAKSARAAHVTCAEQLRSLLVRERPNVG